MVKMVPSHREEHRRAAQFLVESTAVRPDPEKFKTVRKIVAAQRRRRFKELRAIERADRARRGGF